MKQTKLGNSYWDDNGAYQKEYDSLYEELVPPSGEAKCINGKMLRAISRLYYDFCNNGNGNVFEESWGEVSISDFYQEMIDNLDYFMDDRDAFNKLESFLHLPESRDPDFSDKQMLIYDRVIDSIVYQITEELV